MNIALVLAGGMGSRMGQDIPKQFIHVKNRPIIIYTLSALQAHPEIERIQVVCIDGWEKVLSGYAEQFNITKLAGITAGGGTRYESTRAGMKALGDVRDDDVIIVHDFSAASGDSGIAFGYDCGLQAVWEFHDDFGLCGYDVCADGGRVYSAVVERSGLVRGQTPEAVSGLRMREMYAAADERQIQNDSISALQNALGWDIHFAQGSERNIKLTQTEDIELFKALLETKKDAWLK